MHKDFSDAVTNILRPWFWCGNARQCSDQLELYLGSRRMVHDESPRWNEEQEHDSVVEWQTSLAFCGTGMLIDFLFEPKIWSKHLVAVCKILGCFWSHENFSTSLTNLFGLSLVLYWSHSVSKMLSQRRDRLFTTQKIPCIHIHVNTRKVCIHCHRWPREHLTCDS